MVGDSWTHRLARIAVRPLVGTGITPNHLTTLRLLSGLGACGAFALGTDGGNLWGGVLWLISAFLDRADGELARLANMMSAGGHVYDLVTDIALNGLFFLAIGIGLRGSGLGDWAIVIGAVAGGTILAASWWSELLERAEGSGRKAYEGIGGFDFDDILYLFAPIAWVGWLLPLLIGAGIGGPVFAAITAIRLLRIRRGD